MKARYVFFTGPGDSVYDYNKWRKGERTEYETSITHTSNKFDFIRNHAIEAWLISYNQRKAIVRDQDITIENRPKVYVSQKGLGYHLTQVLYALRLIISVISFKPSIVVIDSGTSYWWCFFVLKVFGITLVPNFHNVYYPTGHPPKKIVHRINYFLDSLFFKYCTDSALGVSEECGRQYLELSDSPKSFYQYYYKFEISEFDSIRPPKWPEDKFVILFTGRIVEYKGVFDLVLIAKKLNQITQIPFLFEICGDGPDFEKLRLLINENKLENRIRLNGYLNRPALLEKMSQSHLVIVPTRSNFTEGLPKSCIEAILSNRPVLTNKLSNAIDLLSPAVIEAREEDVDDYVQKISNLLNDSEHYNSLVLACDKFKTIFFDDKNSLSSVLEQLYLKYSSR